MKRKETWYAVVGGCVGAVLTIVVCSFPLLGAQSQSDSNFGKITCTGLEVVNADGKTVVDMVAGRDGGNTTVKGTNGAAVYIWVDENGGRATLYGKVSNLRMVSMKITEDWGQVSINSWNEEGEKKAIMQVGEGNSGVFLQHGESHNRRATMIVGLGGSLVNLEGVAVMGAHDDGASIEVLGKDDKVKASMSVNEYGNGSINTWDKNGYRLGTLGR